MPRPGRSALSTGHHAAIVALVLAAHAALVWTALWSPAPVARVESGRPMVVHIIASPAPVPMPPRIPVPEASKSLPRAVPTHAPRAVVAEAPTAVRWPAPAAPSPAPDAPRETVVAAEPETPLPTEQAPVPVAMSAELAVVCTERVAPSYPADARQRGETGLVVVRVEIDERGWVASARVERSSGHTALDDAALRAVQAWRCTPPTRHGLPAKGVAMQPFNFSLGR